MKKIATTFLITLLVCAAAGYFYQEESTARREASFEAYLNVAHTIDRQIYAGLPIYEDARSSRKEKALRTYLLKDHLAAAAASGMPPVTDAAHIKELVKAGKLNRLKQETDTPYYFFNVRNEHRYLTPHAQEGLLKLTETLQEIVRARLVEKFEDQVAPQFTIKIAISSALRPIEYQQSLRGRNANAAFASSHSSALSFDIFYDDFFIALPMPEPGPGATEQTAVRRQLGFLIGRARRRQLRSMLVEALLKLQEEGVLYAIWERNQRCYHVTILPDGFKD